ncbi:MAG: FAD binding domain-containing protein [Phycisphaerales bacterium]|nr:MAG: FAD binding domain-containing protein [Phycisphaerales bacterium]
MFYQPTDMAEALRLRAELGPEVVTVCGGTDVVVAMNHGVARPEAFLDLSRVAGRDSVERVNGIYLLGGGVTFAQMAKLPVRALAEAARSVGGPQIRNVGTIAGNLGTASPAGDGSVALLALDAEVELSHVERGSRWVRLEEFFLDYKRTALQPDELITRVRFPSDFESVWYKIGKRGAVNISIVCCAIGRSPAGAYRIALGSVGPVPMRAMEAEAVLNGDSTDAAHRAVAYLADEVIERAAEAAELEAAPIDDQRSSARYREAMCRVLVRRLLRELRDG